MSFPHALQPSNTAATYFIGGSNVAAASLSSAGLSSDNAQGRRWMSNENH